MQFDQNNLSFFNSDLLQIKRAAQALTTTVQNSNRTLGSEIERLSTDISDLQGTALRIMRKNAEDSLTV